MPNVGQRHRFSAAFTATGTAADPTTVTVQIMDPDGIVTQEEPVDDAGLGAYHVDVDLTKPGPWIARFSGTGTVPAAAEETVFVDQSPFYAPA